MLFSVFLLPLAVSASIFKRAPEAANVVVETLEPKYRKTANRNLYKVGRKLGGN
jgi:hypothetical protein